MTPSRFDIDYVEVEDLPGDDAFSSDYDAVAISSFTAQIKEAYALADRFRQRGTRVILGGLHVTVGHETEPLAATPQCDHHHRR